MLGRVFRFFSIILHTIFILLRTKAFFGRNHLFRLRAWREDGFHSLHARKVECTENANKLRGAKSFYI